MFFMSSMLGCFHVLWFAFGHCHFGGISCHLHSIEFSHRFGLVNIEIWQRENRCLLGAFFKNHYMGLVGSVPA